MAKIVIFLCYTEPRTELRISKKNVVVPFVQIDKNQSYLNFQLITWHFLVKVLNLLFFLHIIDIGIFVFSWYIFVKKNWHQNIFFIVFIWFKHYQERNDRNKANINNLFLFVFQVSTMTKNHWTQLLFSSMEIATFGVVEIYTTEPF